MEMQGGQEHLKNWGLNVRRCDITGVVTKQFSHFRYMAIQCYLLMLVRYSFVASYKWKGELKPFYPDAADLHDNRNSRVHPPDKWSCDLPVTPLHFLRTNIWLPPHAVLLIHRQAYPLLCSCHPPLNQGTRLPAAKDPTPKGPSDTQETGLPIQEGLHRLPQGLCIIIQNLQTSRFYSPSFPHIHRWETVGRLIQRRGGTCSM